MGLASRAWTRNPSYSSYESHSSYSFDESP
jgi:hypothetical protein